jgi:hypothetical protein
MSIRIIGVQPCGNLESMSDYAGGAIVSNNIELNVAMATNIVSDGTGSRQISRGEVLLALEYMKEYVARMTWPPAAS